MKNSTILIGTLGLITSVWAIWGAIWKNFPTILDTTVEKSTLAINQPSPLRNHVQASVNYVTNMSEDFEEKNWQPLWGHEFFIASSTASYERLKSKLIQFREKIATTPEKKQAVETLLQKIEDRDNSWIQRNLWTIIGILLWAWFASAVASMVLFITDPEQPVI